MNIEGTPTTNGSKIILTIVGGGLKNVSGVATTGFKVTKGGTSDPNEKVNITEETGLTIKNGNTIELSLQNNIGTNDGNIKVSLTGTNPALVKANGTPITIKGEYLVENTQDTISPTLEQSLEATAYNHSTKTITLKANEYLQPFTAEQASGFTVTGDSNITGEPIVTKVVVSKDSKEIILTLNNTFTGYGIGNITVSYAGTAIKDTNNNAMESSGQEVAITNVIIPQEIRNTKAISQNSITENGVVTTINMDKPANKDEIQSMLTENLRYVQNLIVDKYIELDFSNIDIYKLSINSKSITGNGKLNILVSSRYELELAKKLNGNPNIEINNKKPQTIINDNNYRPPYDNNASSSSGSSSGSSIGGATINNVTDSNTENNNNNNSNNNINNQGSQDKQLTFDVIKLPSINGEPKVFGDVPTSHWAKTYIDKLSTAGVINGANGNFMPNGKTKRADVTIMLVNLLGLTPESNNKFIDVNPNAYYAPYVGTASNYNIVNGSNGMFNPENVISRQDTMVMIAQILKGLNLNVNTYANSLNQFSDLGSVSNYAQESVAILVNSGIISGNNGKLNPKDPVTRAEMATIMSKLYDVLAASK